MIHEIRELMGDSMKIYAVEWGTTLVRAAGLVAGTKMAEWVINSTTPSPEPESGSGTRFIGRMLGCRQVT